jgi:hypothetical protein
MTKEKKGEAKASPKSSTERGQTRTAKDNAWAQEVSNDKYKTLRSLMGAIHAGRYALAETQPTPRALDAGESPANLSLFSAEVIRPAKVTRKSPRQ